MFLQSHLLSVGNQTLFHGFFNRHNGVSRGPFHSLNVSFSVGDDEKQVRLNRTVVKERLGIDYLVSTRQIHENRIGLIDGEVSDDIELDGYDGLITDQPGVGLMVQQADCQAILLFDPLRPAVGALHCGWRGSVCNIISSGITKMVNCFGSEPSTMVAAISPSLGPCCSEFVNHQQELPRHFRSFQVKDNYFDFWRISIKQLIDCGLKKSAVSLNNTCTCCHSDFFSYRAAAKTGVPITGRNCSVIGLKA